MKNKKRKEKRKNMYQKRKETERIKTLLLLHNSMTRHRNSQRTIVPLLDILTMTPMWGFFLG